MFPLISSLDDFLRARQVVRDCLRRLKAEGLEHHDHPSVGMMVELPSVAATMAEFAAEADFFAIGTNDFVQYMLGVDRSNKHVVDYYCPEHPAVLRALEKLARIANAHEKPISICGEMAHDAAMLPFLIGIGIRRLSVDPQFMPGLHKLIARLTVKDCRDHAKELLTVGSIADVRKILTRRPALAA